ncbi:MAG: hypothetical protein VXV98_09640, partial [Candidatus Thermoplasmatota archaeon]|nr:hypothetical protein [Candidatus Thermoplasmatota archaeon]
MFENAPVPDMLLSNNPIMTDSGDSSVRVLAPDHGFVAGDTVLITGFDSAGSGVLHGIESAGAINNVTHTITKTDGFGYQFEIPSGSIINATGRIGGARVKTQRQILMDTVIPQFDTLVPQDTNITVDAKFTTGRSYSGTETRFQKDTTFSGDLSILQENNFSAPRLVATTANETANLGAGEKSVTIRANMNTTRADVSPVVDTQRTALTTAHHRIDNQVSGGATAGVSNVPLLYVAETQPFGGSALSKHITRPITLLEDAI